MIHASLIIGNECTTSIYQQFNKISLWFWLKVSLCSSATITGTNVSQILFQTSKLQ